MKSKKLLALLLTVVMLFTMSMTAFANNDVVAEVGTSDEFITAISASNPATIIKLKNDIKLSVSTDPYVPTQRKIEKNCTIDLGEYTLDKGNVDYFYTGENNIKITGVKGKATIKYDGASSGVFYPYSGSVLTFENITFSKVGTSYVYGVFNSNGATEINMDNCDLSNTGSKQSVLIDNSLKTIFNIKDTVVSTTDRVFQNGTYVISGESTVSGSTGGTVSVWSVGNDVSISFSDNTPVKKANVTVNKKDGSIGYFENLADALKVATAEDTITLLSDTKLSYKDVLNNDYNVALNGKTLTFSTVGSTDTTLRLSSNWNFIGDAEKKSKINFEVDPEVETNESLLAIGYYDNKSFTVKMSDLQLVVPNAKKIYTAFVGVYDGSILDLSNVDVKAEDKTKEIPSIFYGNDVNTNNTIKMRNVKISDIKAEEVLSVFGNVDVEYLTVNAEITGFMLSRVNGTIKNSDFTYSQGKSGSLRAVIRQWSDAHNDAVTLLNTTFNEIPGTFINKDSDEPEHNTQIALFKDYDVLPNVYMDEKTATYFADEAVAKAKPANGYFKDADGKIKETKVKVNDSVANAGITVTLDDLRLNSGVDHSEDATYDVVVSNIKVDDRAAVEGIKNDAANANKTIIAYDISVTKTVGNQTTKATGITNQKVTLTLPTPVKGGETPIVYHINDSGVAEEITTPITVSADGKTITFTAPSFSGYAVAYTPSITATSEVTNEIAVKFESVAGKDNEYNIVLEATDGKVINEFTSADLTFKLTSTEAVSYDVHPSLNMNIIKPAKNRFTIYNDGINRHEHTGTRVPIGKVVFGGYCTGAEFSIDGTALTNVVYATKAGTAIVDEYNPTATTNKLKIDSKISPLTIKEETKNLTINIDFPNAVEDNVKAYQDMKVKISSAKSTETIDLGTDAKAMVGGKYTITKDLAKGTEYTVEISGAGYRTAYYTLTLTKDTTLNFWNDWKRAGEVEVEVGNANSKTDVTFLAGDIVKDDVINIYDLSAVVSYFNKNLDKTAYSSFACYDLDRNGVIESRDISILLEGLGH